MTQNERYEPTILPDSVLLSAVFLFREYGYDQTTFAQIANSSGVSQSELSDRCKSKDDILGAIFASEFEASFKMLQDIVNGTHTSSIDSANRFSISLVKHHVHFVPPSLWRRAIAMDLGDQTSKFSWTFGTMITRNFALFQSLTDRLLQEKLLKPDTDTTVLADCLHSVFVMALTGHVRSDETPIANLEHRLSSLNSFILANH